MNYLLIDSGDGKKLEQVGKYRIIRPSPIAIWKPFQSNWDADLIFSREDKNEWTFKKKVDPSWPIEMGGIKYKVMPTSFGHLGVFFEHQTIFELIRKKIKKNSSLLNLFAYTGGATIAAALAGAKVCHLDASKKVVDWAKENFELNDLSPTQVRWIVDDVFKFLKREVKRNNRYDAIILDPPTFGRGTSGQLFKIEEHLFELLDLCRSLLSNNPLFLILSCHTPGFSTTVLENILKQIFGKTNFQAPPHKASFGKFESHNLFLQGSTHLLPSGNFVLWEP